MRVNPWWKHFRCFNLFFKTDIDYLVIGNIIINKKLLKNIKNIIKKLEINRKKNIVNNEKK